MASGRHLRPLSGRVRAPNSDDAQKRPPPLTRLSRLHPYPAMVGDELAFSLAQQYVSSQASVLDPFCGSGKLLVAAEDAAIRVGIDANPLAWLLTKAKLALAQETTFAPLVAGIEQARRTVSVAPSLPFLDRKVDWFAPPVLFELQRIVCWIN